tara:strand:+ start:172 stop:1032 length:861 start_codon:yes stop_codon:yes gene_type:complete
MMISFTDFNKNKLEIGLYVVSTPIGNLSDISFRAIDVLNRSDFIICEDTRVSKKLLEKYKIKNKLISNHKFNEKKNLRKFLDLLKSDKIISLISDAGTPCVSDPGSILVNEAIKENIKIFSVPGPSSATAAFSVSGFTGKYFFYGFFPEKKSELENDFKKLINLNSSIIFFISAKKFDKKKSEIRKYFSNRKLVICKEITKLYEEYIRFDVNDIDNININLKGEITLVFSPLASDNENFLNEDDKKKIKKLIKKSSIKDIIKIISKKKKISKKEIYNFCLDIKNEI